MDERPREQLYEAFGAYVRSQRQLARLTLRQAADLARISNPYLSQIEHGLALPSVRVITALADALHVSADTLLMRAAGMGTGDPSASSTAVEDAIRQDPRLDESQKHALLAVLGSYLGRPVPVGDAPAQRSGPARKPSSTAAAGGTAHDRKAP